MTQLHLTTLSGGGGSWLAGRVVQRERVRPGDEHWLLFTDTLYEDADAYRFMIEGALNIFGRKANWIPAAEDFPDYRVDPATPLSEYRGNPAWRDFLRQLRGRAMEAIPELMWEVEGRDIWEVCRDERFLVNSGVDPCSKILKRQMLDKWLAVIAPRPEITTIYFGIGSGEAHRYDGIDPKTKKPVGIKHRLAASGWRAEAPLIGRIEGELHASFYMAQQGITPPRLYAWAGHNNCQGSCGKAGIKHRLQQLANMPDRYAYDALMEQKFMEYLGQGTFLEDRRGGVRRPMSLVQLASRQGLELADLVRADEEARLAAGDSGNGCACFSA